MSKHVWERPDEFGAGWTRAFQIIVPASEVVGTHPYSGSEVLWYPAPAPGNAVFFTILLSKPDAARGRRGYPNQDGYAAETEFVTRLDMTTGERLWVLAHEAPLLPELVRDLAQVKAEFGSRIGSELEKRVEADPDLAARGIAFLTSTDGSSFIDVSLEHLTPAGRALS